jgi:hypothetical protein
LRRGSRLPFFSIVLTTLLLAAIAQPLWAHAVLMQSKPALNATVKGPNVPIWLRFNVRVDGKRSKLQLTSADGATVPVEALKQTAPDILESGAADLKPGAYKLLWRVLASDGHMSNGEIDFTVD